jgi:F0F1-type ATP synthase membrane subunit a
MSFFTFFFRILSLCIRLFVNMLAGHLLVDIIQYFIFLSSFFDFYTLFC